RDLIVTGVQTCALPIYRLDEATSTLAIDVYDPNHPDDDSCVLSLSVADPTGPTAIAYVAGEAPVRGFFQTAYRRPIGQDITRIEIGRAACRGSVVVAER